MKESGIPLRDPHATCEGCGATGTIGRIVLTERAGTVVAVHRYCRACWPTHRARFKELKDEEWRASMLALRKDPGAAPTSGTGYEIGGASWHGVLELVRDVLAAQSGEHPASPEQLAMLCDRWPELEREFEEPMPSEARAFYEAHRSRAS